jgi:hypothetical protein
VLELIIAHLVLHVYIGMGHSAMCVKLQRGSGKYDECRLWKMKGYVLPEWNNVMKEQKDTSLQGTQWLTSNSMLAFRELFTMCGNTTQTGHVLAIRKETLIGRTDRRTSPVGLLVHAPCSSLHREELAL